MHSGALLIFLLLIIAYEVQLGSATGMLVTRDSLA